MEKVRFTSVEDARARFWNDCDQGIEALHQCSCREWRDEFPYRAIRALMVDSRVIGKIEPGKALMELQEKKEVTVRFKVPHLNWSTWFHQVTEYRRSGKTLSEYEREDAQAVHLWERGIELKQAKRVLVLALSLLFVMSFVPFTYTEAL